MFTSKAESNFFLRQVDHTKKVLEYGSGESTFEIASRCSWVFSVEHQKLWYDRLDVKKPGNCHLFLRPPQARYIEGLSDGNYEQFSEYVECPIPYSPFDIILIDGRARMLCASICHLLVRDEKSLVFIHDFEREEYHEALKYLDLIAICDTMAMFKVKKI